MSLLIVFVIVAVIIYSVRILIKGRVLKWAVDLAIILFVLYPLMATQLVGKPQPIWIYNLSNNEEATILSFTSIPNQEIDVLLKGKTGRPVYVQFPWKENSEHNLEKAKMKATSQGRPMILKRSDKQQDGGDSDGDDLQADVAPKSTLHDEYKSED